MNNITIIGNIGQQPELRHSSSGVAVIDFSVGVTRKVKDIKETTWFDVVAFSDLAEHMGKSFYKGNRVIIEGRFERKEWTTKDGKKAYKMQIIAEDGGLSCRWNNVFVDSNDVTKQIETNLFKNVPSVETFPNNDWF